MSSRNLRIIAAVAIALITMIVGGACWLLLQLLDPDLHVIYQRALAESLILNEDSETVVEGSVILASRGCENGGPREGREDCHFVLKFNGLTIYVYYLNSPGGESCLNTEAAHQGSLVRNGDEVEVFGEYYAVGSLSTCDSADYYIRQLATVDNLTVEPSGTQEPLSEATPAANPKMEAILLWWSYLGLHNNGDNVFLHVVVRDSEYQFQPETIEVIDPATGQSVGPYELHDPADTDPCPWLGDYGRMFVTEGIDESQLPPVFQDFITYDPRIFRVTVREITGEREIVDIAEIPGVCESTSQ